MGVDGATLEKTLLVAPVLVTAVDTVVDDVAVAFCYVGETAAVVVGDGAYSMTAVEGAAGSALTLPPVPLTTNKYNKLKFYHPKTRCCAASLTC